MTQKMFHYDAAGAIRRDGEDEVAHSQKDADKDAVIRPKPATIPGPQGDTLNKWPFGTKNPPKDWDLNPDGQDHSK